MTKQFLGLGALTLMSVSIAHAVPYDRHNVQQNLNRQSTEIVQTLNNNSADTIKNMHNRLMDMANNVNMATTVETHQKQVTATAIIQADMEAREKEIATKNALRTQNKMSETKADYGVATGQGYRVCSVMKDGATMTKLQRQTRDVAENSERNTANVGGKLGDRLEMAKNREAVHLEHFCNETDVAQNKCKTVSNYANADSNANTLFASSRMGSTTDIAKDMVRENIMGQAPMSIPAEHGRSALGQAYLYAQNQQTALKAVPNYALSYIQAYTTVRDDIKDADGNPVSPQEQARAIVGRYYGGEEAVNWMKTLTVQRPRGLLVELSNAQDIMIWQFNQLNEIANIEIATKASGLLSLSETEDKKLAKQYERLKANSVQNNVR